jgi:hypothetical protein
MPQRQYGGAASPDAYTEQPVSPLAAAAPQSPASGAYPAFAHAHAQQQQRLQYQQHATAPYATATAPPPSGTTFEFGHGGPTSAGPRSSVRAPAYPTMATSPESPGVYGDVRYV